MIQTILLAEAAQEITNGFESAFGANCRRVVCWIHMDRNVKLRLKGPLLVYKREIVNDIHSLQLAANQDIFEAA